MRGRRKGRASSVLEDGSSVGGFDRVPRCEGFRRRRRRVFVRRPAEHGGRGRHGGLMRSGSRGAAEEAQLLDPGEETGRGGGPDAGFFRLALRGDGLDDVVKVAPLVRVRVGPGEGGVVGEDDVESRGFGIEFELGERVGVAGRDGEDGARDREHQVAVCEILKSIGCRGSRGKRCD